MGLKLFTASGLFMPADYGLVEGDVLDLVLVAGGNAGYYDTSGVQQAPFTSGLPGEPTSFGAYYTAVPGLGSVGVLRRSYDLQSDAGTIPLSGAGGYVPGSLVQGGNGIQGSTDVTSCPLTVSGTKAGSAINGNRSILADGGGNFGAGSCINGSLQAFGGSGYGAGGGSIATYDRSRPLWGCSGWAGQILYATHILSEEDITNGIQVSVGAGFNARNKNLSVFDAALMNRRQDIRATALFSFSPYGVRLLRSFLSGLQFYSKITSMGAYWSPSWYGQLCLYDEADGFVAENLNISNIVYNASSTDIWDCNGYMLRLSGLISNQEASCTLYWTKKEAMKKAASEGTSITSAAFKSGEDYGTEVIKLPARTTARSAGCYEDAVVVLLSASQIRVYDAFDPTAEEHTYRDITLSEELSGIPSLKQSNCILVPIGDRKMQLVQMAENSANNSDYSGKIVFNIDTGVVSSVSWKGSQYLCYNSEGMFIEGTKYCRRLTQYSSMQQQYWVGSYTSFYQSSTYSWQVLQEPVKNPETGQWSLTNIPCSPPSSSNWNNTAVIWAPAGNGTYICLAPNAASTALSATVTEIPAISRLSVPAAGYDNMPGVTADSQQYPMDSKAPGFSGSVKGGGAGGCCLVMW